MINQTRSDRLVYWDVRVVVLVPISFVVRDVQVDGIVALLWYSIPVVLQRLLLVSFVLQMREWTHLDTPLFFRTVVHTSRDDIPPRVNIRKQPPEGRTSSCHCELRLATGFGCRMRGSP